MINLAWGAVGQAKTAEIIVTLELLISLAALAVSVLGLVWQYIKFAVKMEGRLVELETKTSLWWNTVGESVKAMVKQPVHYHKDDLIDRFPHIFNEELQDLECILKTEMQPLAETKDPKLPAYAVLLAMVHQEKYSRHVEVAKSERMRGSNLIYRFLSRVIK